MRTSHQGSVISNQSRLARDAGGARLRRADSTAAGGASISPLLSRAKDARCARLAALEMGFDGVSPHRPSAFTLIEIMVVVGIMAIIMAIAIPSVYQQMHKDSMRQAVSDVLDACGRARERAILTGQPAEVRIRPGDRMISVTGSSAPAPAAGANRSYSFEGEAGNEQIVEHKAGTGELFSAKLTDRITITYIAINEQEELQQQEEVAIRFNSDGTADQADIVLRGDDNEVRGITVDVITGIASVQESRSGSGGGRKF